MRLGILSFAHVHAPGYAECLARMPDVELAAIADEDEARGREAVARFGGDYHRDYQELLARDDLAAVIVCSPTVHHREMVVAAAEAGKHVLCEKPLATRYADAEAMVAACRAHGVTLQTAFPMRFSPPAIALRRAVRDGAVGTPLAVMGTNPGRLPPGWFGDPELAGGGAVMDHTVHVADLLRWTFEREIVEVYAEVDTRLHPGLAADDVAVLLLRLEGGLFASLDPSWSRPTTWPTWGGLTMQVVGERGVIAMDAFNQTLDLVTNREPSHRLVPWAEGGDLDLIRAFVDAVRDGTEPAVSGEDGLRATAVALCAYESARRREPVACPDCLIE
jgi:predicted dehydrogenase